MNIMLHKHRELGCNFLLVEYVKMYYVCGKEKGTRHRFSCYARRVDKMCSVSAQRKSNKVFIFIVSHFLIDGTPRRVIFVWNETGNMPHLPFLFSSHMQ